MLNFKRYCIYTYFSHIVPSASPGNVSITSKSTSVNISWSPPDPSKRNGVITIYIVQLNSSSDDYRYINKTHETVLTNASISGLYPYSNYTVAVTAATRIGIGPYSEILEFETLEDGKGYK